MKAAPSRPATSPLTRHHGAQAGARIPLLVAVAFLLGLGGGVYFYPRMTAPVTQPKVLPEPVHTLSAGTKALLQHLAAPVEIRYYALLDPTSATVAQTQFAERADRLLSEYEREGGSKIKVIRFKAQSVDAANAASADGINSFNLDKGDACFLGMAIACKEKKEALQLLVDWEPGLESDLSRTIGRVSTPPPAPVPAFVSQTDPAVIEEVKRAIPNLIDVTVAEGTRILRDKTLSEFMATGKEMEAQIKQAELRFAQAQRDKSEAAQQTARAQLQKLQNERTEKLNDIASRLQEQISAFEKMKKP